MEDAMKAATNHLIDVVGEQNELGERHLTLLRNHGLWFNGKTYKGSYESIYGQMLNDVEKQAKGLSDWADKSYILAQERAKVDNFLGVHFKQHELTRMRYGRQEPPKPGKPGKSQPAAPVPAKPEVIREAEEAEAGAKPSVIARGQQKTKSQLPARAAAAVSTGQRVKQASVIDPELVAKVERIVKEIQAEGLSGALAKGKAALGSVPGAILGVGQTVSDIVTSLSDRARSLSDADLKQEIKKIMGQ
jgi:hypothetical protein